jgi:hypothetical protein
MQDITGVLQLMLILQHCQGHLNPVEQLLQSFLPPQPHTLVLEN